MTERHFAIGEIVKLRSGGPRMTVEEVFPPDAGDILDGKHSHSYRCQWFAGSKLQDGVFTEEGLELCSDEATKTK